MIWYDLQRSPVQFGDRALRNLRKRGIGNHNIEGFRFNGIDAPIEELVMQYAKRYAVLGCVRAAMTVPLDMSGLECWPVSRRILEAVSAYCASMAVLFQNLIAKLRIAKAPLIGRSQ